MSYMEDDQAKHLFAARWLMIPLTRAIDTLVIQVQSENHIVTKALRQVADERPELIEWHDFTKVSAEVSQKQ